MPKFTIEHLTQESAEDAFAKIKTFLGEDDSLRKFDSHMKLSFDDRTLTGKIESSKFQSHIEVQQSNSGAKVLVHVDLPLLLSPFKSQVQDSLKRKLNRYLT